MVNGEANEVASSVIDNYTIFLTDIQSLHGGDFTFSLEIFYFLSTDGNEQSTE